MRDLTKTVEKLCEASRRDFSNPYRFDWPQTLEKEQWYFSPELISIYGTELYDELSEAQKKRLSFYEAVNFFSLNIHGEKPLTEGLARRLYLKKDIPISPYLHHFLDEENKHMVYFAGFCLRYAGKIYPDKKMTFPRDYEPGEEDFLFYAKVLMFEEIVDVYNVRMARDERLAPVAREINRLHHRDEARHLVFGRQIVSELFDEYKNRWQPQTLENVRNYLSEYLIATWKEYFNPDAYKDAGLEDPFEIPEKIFDHPACLARRLEITSRCTRYLLENGILEKEPSL